ncbi:hypothetical protein PSN45_001590 [Yamadazyma tenuis]|uniref:Elongator complex protein 5 n=1 Tax=Candida tenuis (strain ATCC 10573 / BCRC 21748 / CBS 615 / JCM 9827 / NBRC 10315 / NRRL Y-1498 / VKM Y-70) TaxID=590646 RepID=G3BF53_CANTC|nr:uncharacterized protein CANTEDRAFT_116705 [Yamadazyma tenuis ATCC 10573]EGV60639.1 hypothetical protein CANTEDRAFT_116705 [Yamadazyma tenuis ATCC 10573]WEJ94111.1 hypothetical protein PSN45_001590 [Yamadazyma tenuis]
MSTQNSLVLLNRVFSLKDGFPFVLVVDSLLQSSYHLIQEFVHNCNNDIVYLSFETVNKPSYATHFIDCMDVTAGEIVKQVKQLSTTKPESSPLLTRKTLIIVDSLNYVGLEDLTTFVSSLISPTSIVLGVFHGDFKSSSTKNPNFPSHMTLLTYIASSILDVEPYHTSEIDEEEIDMEISRLKTPIIKALHSSMFKITLTNRRKSGRALTSRFIINSVNHTYEAFKETEAKISAEDESLLKDLTTFNLTTNTKQKLAKDQVDLPFMQAQEELGSYSGAIIYEFEKDDDYDEEDPYEDPF